MQIVLQDFSRKNIKPKGVGRLAQHKTKFEGQAQWLRLSQRTTRYENRLQSKIRTLASTYVGVDPDDDGADGATAAVEKQAGGAAKTNSQNP